MTYVKKQLKLIFKKFMFKVKHTINLENVYNYNIPLKAPTSFDIDEYSTMISLITMKNMFYISLNKFLN